MGKRSKEENQDVSLQCVECLDDEETADNINNEIEELDPQALDLLIDNYTEWYHVKTRYYSRSISTKSE